MGRWLEVFVCRLSIACPRMDLPGCTAAPFWGSWMRLRVAEEGGGCQVAGKKGTGNRGQGKNEAGLAVPCSPVLLLSCSAALSACSQPWGGHFLPWKALRKGSKIARMVRAGTDWTRRIMRQGGGASTTTLS